MLSYQGRLVLANTNYDGVAEFKFALVDGAGAATYWSNDGSSATGNQPAGAVSANVSKGLYSILLGDASLPGMTPVPPDVFSHPDVRLRVWFRAGAPGFQQLAPDQRLAAVGYALMAAEVADGSVNGAKIAPGAVDNTKLANSGLTVTPGTGLAGGGPVALGGNVSLGLANGGVGAAQLAGNAVQTVNLADSVVTATKLAAGAVDNTKLANSGLTVSPGAGIAGGGLVALGGTTTLSLADGGVTSVKLASEAASLGKVSAGALTLAQATNLTVAGVLNAYQFVGQLLVPGNVLTGTGATIGGGLNNTASGLGATIAGGEGNSATDEYTTVGGGTNNTAGHVTATVGGGEGNQASGPISTVGGGFQNRAQGPYGTIAGGLNNTVSDAGAAAIVGGSENFAAGDSAFVGAGNSNTNQGYAATIAGGEQNRITMSGLLSAIAGGSGNVAFDANTAIGGGATNLAGGPYATIGGGWGNINQFGTASTVGGGQGNSIEYMNAATIGGGASNSIRGFSRGATIPGGVRNEALGATAFAAGYRAQAKDNGTFVWADGTEADFTSSSSNQFLIRASGGVGINTANPATALHVNGMVTATDFVGRLLVPGNSLNGDWAAIGGGRFNTNAGVGATIAGGQSNTASNHSATVGGGTGNLAAGLHSTVAGGVDNAAGGHTDTVGGGDRNIASGGSSSVAGGQLNIASGTYATVPGGFNNEATGNYALAAGNRAKAAHNGAFVWADGIGTELSSSAADQFTVRASGGTRFFADVEATVGVQLAAGGNSWSVISDRNAKENFTAVSYSDLLARLDAVPVTTWNLKSQDAAIRHIGPMAQDFQAAFGVGEDDRHISTSDADGVAFAAIKGLRELLKEKDTEVAALRAANAALEQRLARIERRLNQLATRAVPAPRIGESGLHAGHAAEN